MILSRGSPDTKGMEFKNVGDLHQFLRIKFQQNSRTAMNYTEIHEWRSYILSEEF